MDFIIATNEWRPDPIRGSKPALSSPVGSHRSRGPPSLPRHAASCLNHGFYDGNVTSGQSHGPVAIHTSAHRRLGRTRVRLGLNKWKGQGFESNWIETIPGSEVFIGLRTYEPEESVLDETYKMPRFELVQ